MIFYNLVCVFMFFCSRIMIFQLISQLIKMLCLQHWLEYTAQLKAADRQLMLQNTMYRWQEHKKQLFMLCSAAHAFRQSADSHASCIGTQRYKPTVLISWQISCKIPNLGSIVCFTVQDVQQRHLCFRHDDNWVARRHERSRKMALA